MAGDSNPEHSELVEKARSFLASIEIKDANEAKKREFLRSKGLQDEDIDQLLTNDHSELAHKPPPLPPRTYPQPPPSRLPDFLSAFTRIAGLVMGITGSVALLYYIAILPRLIKTLQARHSQKLNQLQRLSKVATSVSNLEHESLDVAQVLESQSNVSVNTVEEFKSRGGNKSYRDLVRSILHSSGESHLSAEEFVTRAKELFTDSSEDPEFERCIRRELSHSQFFTRSDPEHEPADPGAEPKIVPTYSISTPAQEETIDSVMERLNIATSAHKEVVSESSPLASSAAQKTLQSLTELTALVSGQMYSLPSSFRGSFGALNNRAQNTLGPAEEEVRRELRSLKGLLLNRRTFATVASARTPNPSHISQMTK